MNIEDYSVLKFIQMRFMKLKIEYLNRLYNITL